MKQIKSLSQKYENTFLDKDNVIDNANLVHQF